MINISDDVRAWWFLPAGFVILIGWLAWERSYRARGRAPMVDLKMFRIRTFAMGASMITMFFAGSTSIWVLIAIFAQNGMDQSPLVSGLLGLPAALVSIYSAPLAGKLHSVCRIRRDPSPLVPCQFRSSCPRRPRWRSSNS